MLPSLIFQNIKKSYITVLSVKRLPWAPIRRRLLTIPGMPGALLENTDVEPLPLAVEVLIESDGFDNLERVKEDLAAWLITEKAEELVFESDPERTYYAAVDGSLNLDELVRIGKGVITFICPDPYKYGTEKTAEFTTAASFVVEGSVETNPIITVQVKEDTTYLAVSNGKDINMIGNPVRQDQQPMDPETRIFTSDCSSLVGWTTASGSSIEYSDLMGTMKTDGNSFYTDDYGVSATSWHGPAIKTSLTEVVQDFRYDVGLSMRETALNQAGGIEVALLDANNRIIARIQLTKHFGGLSTLYTRIRAGTGANGHDIVTENEANFQSSAGVIFRIFRTGNVWRGIIYEQINGVWQTKVDNTWTDDEGIAAAAVTQVQVRLIQRADFPVVEQYVTDINLGRLNNLNANQVPIIARAGDIVQFDHSQDIIRRNGEDMTKEKAFIGEYFGLKTGPNTIAAEPMEAIENVEVRWRERWR